MAEWDPDLEKKDYIISVTGHRPNKLYGYNMDNERYIAMKNMFKKLLVEKHCSKAVSGMALGVDQVYAEAVLELKEAGYKIELIAAIPCQNHSCKWPKSSQKKYNFILSHVDKTVLVSKEIYNPHLMQVRNEYMVNISNEVLAIWDGTNGGTGNCVKYVKELNRPLTILDPKSF